MGNVYRRAAECAVPVSGLNAEEAVYCHGVWEPLMAKYHFAKGLATAFNVYDNS